MTRNRVPGLELETPTEILLESPVGGGPPRGPAAQVVPAGPARTATVQMISMKTPAELAAEKATRPTVAMQVQLRPMSEHARYPTPSGGLGFLAPPRDPASARRGAPAWLRGVGMVLAALALAAAIATAIWFAA